MDSRFSQSARLCTIGMIAASFVEYAEAEKPTDFFAQQVETIPEGRTDQNSPNYSQYLKYSTVLNSKGKQYFDISMYLEFTGQQTQLNENYVMQQWFQIIDVNETADLDESDCESDDWEAGTCKYYESLTCSFQYSDKMIDSGVTIANSIIQGYKGVIEMKNTIGAFNMIAILNKTSTYPWFIDYERSEVIESSSLEGEPSYLVRCSVFRDFVTDWSEIAIKGGDELTAVTGYRMYYSDVSDVAHHKGNSN